MNRRFINNEDFNQIENMAGALKSLIENAIFPKFFWFSNAQFYIDNEENVGNNIRFDIRVADYIDVFPSATVSHTYYDITPFLTNYANNMQTTYDAITKEFSPTVKDNNLIAANLSPDQFLISLVDLTMNIHVGVNSYSDDPPLVALEVLMKLTLTIEDISILDPGEIGELAVRFNYLCNVAPETATTMNELRNWVVAVAHVSPTTAARMDKAQLCLILKTHYKI